jgi:hypothetical protein
MKVFREPTLILAVVSGIITLIGTLGLGFTPDAAALWCGVVAAAAGVATAAATRPVTPGVFLALSGAAVPLASYYGLHLHTETIGTLNVLIVAIVALLTRAQVTPVYSQQPTAPASGPVV